MLQQAKMASWQVGREEYRRVYESRYAATRDTYIAQRDAEEAARQKANDEWNREKERIELQIKRRMVGIEELKATYTPMGGVAGPAGLGGAEEAPAVAGTPAYTGLTWEQYQARPAPTYGGYGAVGGASHYGYTLPGGGY